jgi:hypothetical protein
MQHYELIGRDKLLDDEIYPRTMDNRQFFLTGRRGIGKSALLEWSYNYNQSEKKALVSANWTVREMAIAIVKCWNLELTEEGDDAKKINPDRAQLTVLEKAIAKENSGTIYIDDIHKATPTKIRRIRIWKERFTVYFAGTPPYREEIRPLLWGLKEIEIPPIPQEDRARLVAKMCADNGATVSIEDVVQASRGIPGRMYAMVLGNEVEDTSERVEGEEHDISWTLLVLIAVIVSVRYIGMGLGRFDLYVLGGLFMALGLIVRYFLFKFQKK